MSTTPMTKIREEWKFAAFRFGVDNLEQEDIADWFINRFQQELSSLEGEVEGMFSVYPDGGIHDFQEDEELVSKNNVLAIIRQHKER